MDFMNRLTDPSPVPIGTRIRITGVMPFDPCPMEVGATGTVVGGNECQLWIDWDDGKRALHVLPTDPFEVIPEKEST